ncbi:hypothetical protein [Streptomyces sp. KR2]|uniref:hypothetical protein n=1 Tax=Streptomyces sp. KR2 TaxID=1514824 RepID=UPI003F7FF457
MPESSRKSAARSRVLYTGEKLAAAQAGIPRDHSIGLDACRSEQSQFRALLALGYLNHGVDYDGPAGWHLSALSSYTVTVSPRFERTVIITKVPHNVAQRMLPGPVGGSGLPGLRLEQCRGYGSYTLRHMPTGAELVITDNPFGRPVGTPNAPYFDCLTSDAPLSVAEAEQLGRVPDMSIDARRLLAGVFCRITTKDPCGAWAIGNWFYDPLERPGRLDRLHLPGCRSLRGFGDNWELEWEAGPYPEDLTSALTGSVIGIPGASAASTLGHLAVTLGSATLHLRSARSCAAKRQSRL